MQTIILLGLVSLFTDISSEMVLSPVFPLLVVPKPVPDACFR